MFRRLTNLQLGIDLGLGAMFAVLGLVSAVYTTSYATWDLLIPNGLMLVGAFLYPLLLGGALAVRRLSPSWALVAAWAGAVVQMCVAHPPGFVDLAILGVLFATAAYGGRVTYWAGLASAIVGGLIATAYLTGPVIVGLTSRYWFVIGAVLLTALLALLLAWTAGALARSRLQARANASAIADAEAKTAASGERERIARDMHDVVAHSLAVVIAQADGARYAAASDPDAQAAALATISATSRAALADVRLLLTQLRHRQGDGPQPTLADLEGLYAQVRAAGVPLDVVVDPAPTVAPPAGVQLAVYRILQEALTNALRHGGGAPVTVRLAWHPDRVDLEVRNRVPVSAVAGGSGHGLVGMGERAQLAGGTVTAAERDDHFVVTASLPVGAAG